jgi:hypothetical protein
MGDGLGPINMRQSSTALANIEFESRLQRPYVLPDGEVFRITTR